MTNPTFSLDRVPYPPSPAETLPTMYDLPSEDPEEPGLPDEFHDFQPKLLRETCQPSALTEEIFMGSDLNLYYDSRHPQWYKRPDWFLVLGVAPADKQEDLRWSYVLWQEGVSPFLVVELLSPGTEGEDLGTNIRELGKPPGKWEVYERVLRIPFYVVYDRYGNQLRIFALERGRYRAIELSEPRFWFDELGLGLGVWQGVHQGIEGQWLRWYDDRGQWIPTSQERSQQAEQQAETERLRATQAEQQAETERLRATQAEQQAATERLRATQAEQQAETERLRVQKLAERLRELGIDPDSL